jgi:hypothetical protein
MPNLHETLRALPISGNLPAPLPVFHISNARWFQEIVNLGFLRPRTCEVFKRELLYFFYGGAFYRPKPCPTQNASELPIAFIFDPTLLCEVKHYYPFDTGAVATGRFGSWSTRLCNLDQYCVEGYGDYNTPCHIVYHIYESNDRYIRGEVSVSLP